MTICSPYGSLKIVLYAIEMSFGPTSWDRRARYEKLWRGRRDMGGRHTPPLPETTPMTCRYSDDL